VPLVQGEYAAPSIWHSAPSAFEMVKVTVVEFPPSLLLSTQTAFGNADTDVPQVTLVIAVSGAGEEAVGEGTTCVAADTAAAEPFLFVAVTRNRSV
jgi:hypothetical protein